MVLGGTREPGRAKFYQSCWESKSICHHHLRSEPPIIASGHSNLPTDDRCPSPFQSSWQGGDGSPGWCSREEGQHGREIVGFIGISPRNDKCLQSGHISSNDYARLTLVEGRAAQAWWFLISGSCGSSSAKPLILYLRDSDHSKISLPVVIIILSWASSLSTKASYNKTWKVKHCNALHDFAQRNINTNQAAKPRRCDHSNKLSSYILWKVLLRWGWVVLTKSPWPRSPRCPYFKPKWWWGIGQHLRFLRHFDPSSADVGHLNILHNTCWQNCDDSLQSSQCFPRQESHRHILFYEATQRFLHLENRDCFILCLQPPGTISAVSSDALLWPPSRTVELGREDGVHAVWSTLALLWI